jgi:hypothetical protein
VTSPQFPIELTAGPWSASLSDDGSVSRVSWNGTEILRGLSVVVRTNTWLTVVAQSDITVTQNASDFTVTVSARNSGDGVDFSWQGDISAHEDGAFSYSFTGQSHGISSTNRIGLVALHSLNWAGHQCHLRHSDHTEEATSYPSLVSPHQPMKDIARISHQIVSGHQLHISFDGEVFEMEDQRNWTDASFKTYSRPLAWPFPYQLSDGEKVQQKVTLSVDTTGARAGVISADGEGAEPVTITRPAQTALLAWPQIGVSSRVDTEIKKVASVWSTLSPRHLRVDTVCDHSGLSGEGTLRQALSENLPVELAIHLGSESDEALGELVSAINSRPLDAVFVYDLESPSTTPRVMDAVNRILRPSLSPETALFVGTDDNFTELNRNRVNPSVLGASGVTFGLNPQVHDSSERAIIETAEAIPAIVDTAKSFSDNAPIAISPLVLKARRNIYAPGRVIDRLGRDDDSVDSRLGTPFSAVWLMSTMAALIRGGVSRVTLDEIIGPAGIVHPSRSASESPSAFETIVQWLATRRAGLDVSPANHPHIVALYGADDEGGSYAVANTSSSAQTITLAGDHDPKTITVEPITVEIVRVHG